MSRGNLANIGVADTILDIQPNVAKTDVGALRVKLGSRARKENDMTLIIAAIAFIELGRVAGALIKLPPLVIVAACVLAQIGVIVLNNRKVRK